MEVYVFEGEEAAVEYLGESCSQDQVGERAAYGTIGMVWAFNALPEREREHVAALMASMVRTGISDKTLDLGAGTDAFEALRAGKLGYPAFELGARALSGDLDATSADELDALAQDGMVEHAIGSLSPVFATGGIRELLHTRLFSTGTVFMRPHPIVENRASGK